MSSWLPENSIITNLGNSLLASARVGLGTIKITRVVSRETFESSMSTIRRYTLADITAASIAQEGYILNVRLTDFPDPEEEVETSLLTVRFSNEDLEDESTTYNLRQIIILACLVNTETQEEGEEVPYMVCQCADSTECDIMPARSTNPTSFDYDIYVMHSGIDSITVEVRTSGFVWQEDFDEYKSQVEVDIGSLETDLTDKMAGFSSKDDEVLTWIPSYNEDHSEWSKENSESTTICSQGSEIFNVHNSQHTNISSGENSSTFGKDSESLAEGSFTTGSNNYNNAENSFISGNKNSIMQGSNNFISGNLNEIKSGDSNTVFGKSNLVSTDVSVSFTFGEHLINSSSHSFVIGKYNESSNLFAFVIGNGSSNSDRSNAFSIDWEGNAKTKTLTVETLYNPDGTEKTFSIPEDFIKRGEASGTFIANNTSSNTASGVNSSVFGRDNESNGSQSFTTGKTNKTFGSNSSTFGMNNVNRGSNNIVGGTDNSIQGNDSLVFSSTSNTNANSNSNIILGGEQDVITNSTNTTAGNIILSSSYCEITDSVYNVLINAKSTSITGGGLNSVISVHPAGIVDMEDCEMCFLANVKGAQNYLYNSSRIFSANSYNSYINFAEDCNLFGQGLRIEGTDSSNKITNQTVMGKYNKNVTNRVFVIGNGTANSARSNAIEIDNSGNIYCGNDVKSLNERISDLEQLVQQLLNT